MPTMPNGVHRVLDECYRRRRLPIDPSWQYHRRPDFHGAKNGSAVIPGELIANPQPPDGLNLALQALWWDAKGDWDKAHERAQERDDIRAGMRVHAYLHRKEGDQSKRRILVPPLPHGPRHQSS